MKWGKCKEAEPFPQAGYPGTLSSLVPALCGHWAKPSPTYFVHPSPNPHPRGQAVWERGAALVAQRFVHPTIPTRVCCCGRLRARRPSSAPSAQCGHCHPSGTNGVWWGRGGQREREKGGGELVLFPGLEAAPKGSQGQNLCVSVCPPHSLARLSPLRCSPDTSSHRLACFKDGSTSFRSNSPPGSLGSLWSPAPGLLTVSAVLGFS